MPSLDTTTGNNWIDAVKGNTFYNLRLDPNSTAFTALVDLIRDQMGGGAATAAVNTNLENFITQFGSDTATQVPPINIAEFEQKWTALTGYPANAATQAFRNAFENVLVTGTDWAQAGITIDVAFEESFAAWVQGVDWKAVYNGGTFDKLDLIRDYAHFISVKNPIKDESGFGTDLQGYEDLYNAYLSGTQFSGNFADQLQEFVTKMRTDNGYFLPSHYAKEWYEKITDLFKIEVVPVDAFAAATGSSKTSVIFEVLQLIADMVGVLQRTAATQATKLQYYAAEQKAYTDLIGKIPPVGPDNVKNYFGDDLIEDMEKQDQANVVTGLQKETERWTEKLRSYRSLVSDEAKQHQTAVNQSNEIVNQQQSLATALLQQLGTLLQSISQVS